MTQTLTWKFPLARTHTGVPLGNGRIGLLVWGAGDLLRITVGRADLWDHRGGMDWSARQNFADIRAALEADDERRIADLFRPGSEIDPNAPARPSVLPLGRVELALEPGWSLETATLDLLTGTVTVRYADGLATHALRIAVHPEQDAAWIDDARDVRGVSAVTSWDIMGDRLRELSFDEPERMSSGGWFWALPADPGVYVAWGDCDEGDDGDSDPGRPLVLVCGRADRRDTAEAEARERLAGFNRSAATDESLGWWHRYWRTAGRVEVPSRTVQEIHDYGLYLFASLTNPSGVAATLQGPWIEEYNFPPWSSDYHFNINVQMCYSPALRAGKFSHMLPLFELVWSWRDQLRRNAHNFIGVDDGYMLPHAVDDRCTCMGSFWTGTIDHACTAWVAQMMYDYVDYSGDDLFLREIAFPFMRGTFSVYRAMMEDDGEHLRLPVSVSPEYRGARMDAWGANASFQLAAVHRLCENLLAAAELLDERALPDWEDVGQRLPAACVGGGEPGRILLWEGVDLEESHRHHSHLASIAPFDTIDPYADRWRSTVEQSLRHWIGQGMGMWSGWCLPWASQLHSRVGNGAGAEFLLETWRRVFTNEGRASMHDAVSNGVTLMGAPPIVEAGGADSSQSAKGSTAGGILKQAERMQMDGAMGGVAADQEMLLHSRRGVLEIFPAIPPSWDRASFERLRAPGGFVISGWYAGPDSWRVEAEATRAGTLRASFPGAGVIERAMRPGERAVLTSESIAGLDKKV